MTDIVVGQFWERKRDLTRVRVMAEKDKYVMLRVKGMYPFVLPIRELHDRYNPIPIQVKIKTK